ncbi:PREDICTED: uncharacterized protein LOC100635977 [Amphimedon queenslandica]|uniref:MARVEL domain-containing protein n=1 Tax=Amphimedon queenslandica TaxID=400682 RepID=A0A1X7VM01_AMPQE|nr:PREDICTED: uncharacterized protein LOC100635977 [Amphimedon queenslandica]|eukprot:XP_003383499.1 PREDICTED: uncharacterized protein LOC100635977 [Amphimedon queenslandica]
MIRTTSEEKPWGQIIMKVVQIVTLFLAIVLAGAWSSKGVKFTDLNTDGLNQLTAFEFLIVIGVFGIIWAIVSLVVFCFKQDLPAIVVLIITIIMAFFVIISAAVFAASIRDLAVSKENRFLDLNLSALEAACFFAVLGAVAYTGDVILEIIALVFAIMKVGVQKLYLGSCCLN